MRFPRSSGVVLHPISLPGPFGSGDLGPEALDFVHFLAEAGQKLWQLLPLHPSASGNSPFQPSSAFAGNPLLISLARLREQGWLSAEEVASVPRLPPDAIDYAEVIGQRFALLHRAAERFFSPESAASEGGVQSVVQGVAQRSGATGALRKDFEDFCVEQAEWLDDFALFSAARELNGNRPWTHWEPELASRQPEALERLRGQMSAAISACKFWQWEFSRQWKALRQACRGAGIRLFGMLPFYVAHDSADVWASPWHFSLNEAGDALQVAGVPPDATSPLGHLWGQPVYNWERMREDGLGWWKARLRAGLRQFDGLCLSHFTGYDSCYEIAAGAATAVHGSWVNSAGSELIESLTGELGELPLIAENLSAGTPESEAMRARFGFPGMAVLQQAFSNGARAQSYLPHRFERNLVACTSTCTGSTAAAWWTSRVPQAGHGREQARRERERAGSYLNLHTEPVHWAMIRTLLASVADTVLIPMQDLLGLGAGASLRHPGDRDASWRWRYRAEQLRPELARRLRTLTELYER